MITRRQILKVVLMLGDLFFIALSIKTGQWIRLGRYYDIFSMETGASLLAIILFPVAFYMFDLYRIRQIAGGRHFLRRMTMAVLLASPFLGFLFYVMPQYMFGRGVFLVCLVSIFIFCSGWRWLFQVLILDKQQKKRHLLFVGNVNSCHRLDDYLNQQINEYGIIGRISMDEDKDTSSYCHLPLLGNIHELMSIIEKNKIYAVIIEDSLLQHHELVGILLKSRFSGIILIRLSDFVEATVNKIPIREIEENWLLFTNGFQNFIYQYMLRLKRIGDCLVAGIFIALLWPLMLLIAIAVKIDSPGCIIYRQQRVGHYEHRFNVLKFRSMKEKGEENGAVWATENDDRITRVGHWLRRYRLDELPQLFNVLKGEMSMVGPRPERPEFTALLEKEIPGYALRHLVHPGITGWAQIKYHYGASVEDALHKLEYDLYYVKNLSLLLDIKIFLKTVGVVCMGDGAR